MTIRIAPPAIPVDASFREPIRRYAIQWLYRAAARVNERSKRSAQALRTQEHLFGTDSLFDTTDVTNRGRRISL
jgi:hypothetical protein